MPSPPIQCIQSFVSSRQWLFLECTFGMRSSSFRRRHRQKQRNGFDLQTPCKVVFYLSCLLQFGWQGQSAAADVFAEELITSLHFSKNIRESVRACFNSPSCEEVCLWIDDNMYFMYNIVFAPRLPASCSGPTGHVRLTQGFAF